LQVDRPIDAHHTDLRVGQVGANKTGARGSYSVYQIAAARALRAADMPGADELMLRIYAAMAQKERELISERTLAALAAAKACGKALGDDRGYRPAAGP
jgi:hypothetical protein